MSETTRTALASADGGEPIAELRRLTETRGELSRAEAGQVRRARAQGYSWQAIADALDISKQAAHKKHGKR